MSKEPETLLGGKKPLYRTIVADPPWHYDREPLAFAWRRGRPSGEGKAFLSYETMSLAEIKALPVAALAANDAHLYLWTTQRYLRFSYDVAEAWGFSPVKVLTWCKAPTGFALGGVYGSASEFVLFARRGSLPALGKVPRDWFEWPRGEHSRKPDAFLDLVEQISPEPRLELFARRQRLGWDTWGNEALEHVSIPAEEFLDVQLYEPQDSPGREFDRLPERDPIRDEWDAGKDADSDRLSFYNGYSPPADDIDRLAEHRYESWLESLKDHGP